MEKVKFNEPLVILLVISIIVFSVTFVGLQARGSEEARLGSALAEVLLNWKLMVLNGPSYAEGSGLDSSLASLEESLKNLGSPASLTGRVDPLQAKLEKAKSEDIWNFQFGFWNFAQEDPTVSLEGAKKKEDILVDKTEDNSSSKRMGFRYLRFSSKNDKAVISVGEKLDAPLSKSFTVEFWIRVEEGSAKRLVATDSWILGLNDGRLVLKDTSGNRILSGGEVPLNSWTHIGLIRNGEEIAIYLNGGEVNKTDFSGSLSVTNKLVFGDGLIGDIDELRIKKNSVKREYLNFDQPIDYLVGFPVLEWAQENSTSEELWRFYAGLLISNISLKRDSDNYSVSGENLEQVAGFLLKEGDVKREIPSDLTSGVLEDLSNMGTLGTDGDISKEAREKLNRIIDNLSNYLGLD